MYQRGPRKTNKQNALLQCESWKEYTSVMENNSWEVNRERLGQIKTHPRQKTGTEAKDVRRTEGRDYTYKVGGISISDKDKPNIYLYVFICTSHSYLYL